MMLANMKLMAHSNINARAIEAEQVGKKITEIRCV